MQGVGVSETMKEAVPSIADRPAAVGTPTVSAARLGWLDTARGLGIVLVVAGHCIGGLVDSSLSTESSGLRAVFVAVYTFHMPLFFFLSGTLVQQRLEADPARFRTALLRTLVWPYFLWSIIQLCVIVAAGNLVNAPVTNFTRDLFSLPWRPVSQFWFLYALFMMHVASLVLLPRVGPVNFLFLALAARAVATPYDLPPIVSDALAMFPYYAAGVMLRPEGIESCIIERPRLVRAVLMPLIAALAIALATIFVLKLSEQQAVFRTQNAAELAKYSFRQFEVMGAAILGTAAAIGIASLASIQSSGVLGWLGRISMPIYLLHIMFIAGTRIILVKLLHIENVPLIILFAASAGLCGPIIAAMVAKRLGLEKLLVLR